MKTINTTQWRLVTTLRVARVPPRRRRPAPPAAALLTALITTLLAALLPNAAHAWGPVGHQAVGGVADALLTPSAKAAVAELLADDRDRDGRFSGRHTLAEVADWSDEIRGGPGDHPHWHYDNRPACGDAAPAGTWCARGDCASAQLPAMLAVLADRSRSRAERNVALKWIVHLSGDVHQPLHAADLADGGNRIRVAPYGRSGESARSDRSDRPRDNGEHHSHNRHNGESLHAFWDSHLVNLALHPDDGLVPVVALDDLLQRARAEDAASLAAPPQRWAEESNRIARHFALDIPGVDCDVGNGDEPTVRLSRTYVTQARRIVVERLALAGARLAYVLNGALGPH